MILSKNIKDLLACSATVFALVVKSFFLISSCRVWIGEQIYLLNLVFLRDSGSQGRILKRSIHSLQKLLLRIVEFEGHRSLLELLERVLGIRT